jgi:hypothetical protein
MKMRALLYLTVGLISVLLLTACAGVAAGQLTLPLGIGPSVDGIVAPVEPAGAALVEQQMPQAEAKLMPRAQVASQVQSAADLLMDGDAFSCGPKH